MKRLVAIFVALTFSAALVACSSTVAPTVPSDSVRDGSSQEDPGARQASSDSSEAQTVPSKEENQEPSRGESGASSLESIEESTIAYVENAVAELNSDYADLLKEVDTYQKYLANPDKVEQFYQAMVEKTKAVCLEIREQSLAYAKAVISSDMDRSEKYDALDGIFDCMYEDARDIVFDDIYDDLRDEAYDTLYDGVLEDAYDVIPYKEWSDARSDAYEWWSDSGSDVYEEWSDCGSDVYGFWSDVKSEVFQDDPAGVQKEIEKFRKDIEKLK